MKAKSFKKVLALALTTTILLTACGQKPAANTSESTKTSESTPTKETTKETEQEPTVTREELPIITLYPKDANLFSGLVTGYRGDYFAEEGGFQLEVWAYSADKTNAMLTSGDLPDIMYLGSSGTDILTTLIETDKIINFDDYKEYLPHVFGDDIPCEYITPNLDIIRADFSAGTGGLYTLPAGFGVNSAMYKECGTFDRNVPKLKWDVYEAIGAPEITDLWGLLDIAEEMLAYQPVAEDGTPNYGMYLDPGLDSDKFGSMHLWNLWHGVRSNYQYFVECNAAFDSMKSIFDEDSVYKEGVKWYNEAYRRGLIDPDSISTPRPEQMAKVENGLAMLPAGTAPGWAPTYFEVFPSDVVVYYNFINTTLTNVSNCFVVNKDAENLEKCLKLVDMFADPYAFLNIHYGPDGHMWQSDGNVLSITDEFAAWLKEHGTEGGFPMPDGTEYSIWNTPVLFASGTPIPGYVDINGNEVPYVITVWPDAQAITNASENLEAWKKNMDANDLWDYCEKNNITVDTMPSVFSTAKQPVPSDSQKITIASIKDVVVPATWQCVYAESEEEMEKIWDQMVEDAMALGAQDIIDWFMEAYEESINAINK